MTSLDRSLSRLKKSIENHRQKNLSLPDPHEHEEDMPDKETDKQLKPQQTAQIIRLPTWSEPSRGVPNSALRGALFAAIQGKNRRALKREVLAVQNGMTIRFTGWQLDQSDLDVWEQALHLAREHPLGNICEFTAYGFLKALGRSTGKRDHEWLKDVFARLTGCSVEITHDGKTYFGPLIERGGRDEATGHYVLQLNPSLATLYSAGWTACVWEERQRLRGKPLALWLHSFYASHADPYPLKVETLMQLSGSRTKRTRDFKRELSKALDVMKELGAITKFKVDGDLVSVVKRPSRSQAKYLKSTAVKKA